MARYAISDIHGCIRTFKKALREVNFSKEDTLVLIGDYIDRGLDSKGVIDYIIELQDSGHNVIPLKGNHEDFLIGAATNTEVLRMWLYNGAYSTLLSYGFDIDSKPQDERKNWIKAVPDRHWEFYKSLKTIHVMDDYVFVHGGLDYYNDDPINETSDDTKMLTRIYRSPLDTQKKRLAKVGGRVLVTGHTPTDKQTMIEMTKEDLITIDRGCCFSGSDYGHLAVLNLDNKELRFIKNIDLLDRD